MFRQLSRLVPFALVAACAHAPPVPTPYAADACPLPTGSTGYTVVARAEQAALADQPYLRHVVREVVSRWDPSGKPWRDHMDSADFEYAPSELFWRGGWRPWPDQRADVAVAIQRDGSWSAPRLVSSGPDSAFVRGVLDAVRRTLSAPPRRDVQRDTARFALPAAAAASGADSLVVHLLFGERPREGESAVARFAVQQRPVAPRTSVQPVYPADLAELGRKGTVLMQFVVNPAGRVDSASMRVLKMDDRAFALEVLRVLPRYTFTPAMLDCAPVPQLVQLPFTFDVPEPRSTMSSRPRSDRSPLQPTTGSP